MSEKGPGHGHSGDERHAVLDPPAQAILSFCSVDVWTAACIALEVSRQWNRFGTGDGGSWR